MCWFYGEDKSARGSIRTWKMVKNSPPPGGGRFGRISSEKDYVESRAAKFCFFPAAMAAVTCKYRQFGALETKDEETSEEL